MNYVREFILLFWKFVSWTPADLLYTTNTISSNVYTSFHGKIVWSNLKLLFINIIQIGVLLDVLFLFNMLRPSWKTTTLPYSRIIGFTFLSVLNVVHHLVFLLLRNKKNISKYQSLISAVSFGILCFLVFQFQVIYHPKAPVEVWVAFGLLQMVVAMFYCQGSFVCSVVVWITSALWITGGMGAFGLQVNTQFLPLTSISLRYMHPHCTSYIVLNNTLLCGNYGLVIKQDAQSLVWQYVTCVACKLRHSIITIIYHEM